MGFYTHVEVSAFLESSKMDKADMRALLVLLRKDPGPGSMPAHRLFTLPRWEMTTRCCYAGFEARARMDLRPGMFAMFRSSAYLKDYDGESAAMADWLRPLLYTPHVGPFLASTTEDGLRRIYNPDGTVREISPPEPWGEAEHLDLGDDYFVWND